MNKQYILDEIKRTALINGRIPLGKDSFFRETGIKYSDWFGKFWARWNDAVREAGFAPHEFKTTVIYEEDELLEKYIILIRSLGHLPVKGELRMIRRKDKSMPSDYTFQRRFGSKQGLITKVISYCSRQKNTKMFWHCANQ